MYFYSYYIKLSLNKAYIKLNTWLCILLIQRKKWFLVSHTSLLLRVQHSLSKSTAQGCCVLVKPRSCTARQLTFHWRGYSTDCRRPLRPGGLACLAREGLPILTIRRVARNHGLQFHKKPGVAEHLGTLAQINNLLIECMQRL